MNRLAMMLGLVALFTGCARGDAPSEADTASADRTVLVTMRDNHFEPDEIEVERGETIAFRFLNRGSSRHDAFFGDEDEQTDHEEKMRAADGEDEHGGGHADEEDAAIVEPGESAVVLKTFEAAGETLIGCHEPGHYADGMLARVSIG